MRSYRAFELHSYRNVLDDLQGLTLQLFVMEHDHLRHTIWLCFLPQRSENISLTTFLVNYLQLVITVIRVMSSLPSVTVWGGFTIM